MLLPILRLPASSRLRRPVARIALPAFGSRWRAVAAAMVAVLLGGGGAGGAGAQDGGSGTVVGLVFDSTASAPLAGARVAVMGTSVVVDADESGQFRLDEVPAGTQTLIFFHERLGALGVGGTPLEILVRDGAVSEAYLSVPSRATLLAGWCSAEAGEGDTSVGGIVTDAVTGVPLPRARVIAFGEATGLLQRRRVLREARTGNNGEYRLCHLDSSQPLEVVVAFGNGEPVPLEITRAGPQIADLSIRISDPVTITGSVLDHATGSPIPGAHVRLIGSSHAEFADSLGRFGFAGVPPGRQIIETSVIGYATRLDSLTAFSNEALGIEIRLATEAIALAPLVVTGRRSPYMFSTVGTRFRGLTEARVDSIIHRVTSFPALAREARVPGVQIRETMIPNAFGDPQWGVCIEMQRGRGVDPNTCNMVEVRINDGPVPEASFFLMELNPQDVRRIQFIAPMDAGLLYGDRGANGVLLIYTR